MKDDNKELLRTSESAAEELRRVLEALRSMDPQPIAKRAADVARLVFAELETSDATLAVGVWISDGNSPEEQFAHLRNACGTLFPQLNLSPTKTGLRLVGQVAGERGPIDVVVGPVFRRDDSKRCGYSPQDVWMDLILVDPAHDMECADWLDSVEEMVRPDKLVVPPQQSLLMPAQLFASSMRRRPRRRMHWLKETCALVQSFLTREQRALGALSLQLEVRLSNLRELRKKATNDRAATLQKTSLTLETVAATHALEIEKQFADEFELNNLRRSEIDRAIEGNVRFNRVALLPKTNDVPARFVLKSEGLAALQALVRGKVDTAWRIIGGKTEPDCCGPFKNAIEELHRRHWIAVEAFAEAHKGVLPPGALRASRVAVINPLEQIHAEANNLLERLNSSSALVVPPEKQYEAITLSFDGVVLVIGSVRKAVMEWTMPFSFVLGIVVGGVALAGKSSDNAWVAKVLMVLGVIGGVMAVVNMARNRQIRQEAATREFRKNLESQIHRSYERLRGGIRGGFGKILALHAKDHIRTLREDLERVSREIDFPLADRERLLLHRRELATANAKQLEELLRAIGKQSAKLDEVCARSGREAT